MWLKILGVIGLLIILATCALGYRAVTISLDAEKTLQAYCLVSESLTKSLDRNSEDWPHSWDELMQRARGQQSRLTDWPNGIADLSERVHVDFQLTRQDVAAMKVDSFTAVTQREPNFGPHDPGIAQLIKTAAAGVGSRKVGP
jgi:hypothetical protein